MNNKDTKFRALAITAICISVVCISIAYAALGASLNVTGTAKVSTTNSWKVAATSGSCTASGSASIIKNFEATGETVQWSASFKAPKDKVTCTFAWENSGTIDAAVNNLIASSNGDAQSYFTYSVKMGDTNLSTTVPANKYLKAGSSKDVTIEVVFDAEGKLSGDELSNINSQTATFTAAFEFVQATSGIDYTEL